MLMVPINTNEFVISASIYLLIATLIGLFVAAILVWVLFRITRKNIKEGDTPQSLYRPRERYKYPIKE